ncbi:hypothetical protein TWF970_007003 [Orbilia oligospora]|uniref:Zn(2)-C6 fungal-type domain-containing protein n=1 Tax=Orbilia oligospora TaxID=2813651 RepID=A0A7C8VWL7_ORBOL|nr:hypothetical protein TWF970_007003 [Orbilia oligospora]
MLTIQKNRHACDRCHGHKLSCKRESASGPCARCSKAKVKRCITPKSKRPTAARLICHKTRKLHLSPASDMTSRNSGETNFFADRNSNPSYDYINPNFLLESPELAPLSWDGLDLSPETGFAPTSDQTSKQSEGTLISTTNFPDLFDGEVLEYRKLGTSPTNTVPTANYTAPYFFDYDPTSVGLSGREFTVTSGHENRFSTKGNWIDRVAELHVRLYIQHGSQDRSAQNFAAATDRFNVGETFALSQNLLETQK